MSDIVKQSGNAHDFGLPSDSIIIDAELRLQQVSIAITDTLEQPGCDVHRTERVFESSVRGSGIDVVRPRKLFDSPEPLERGLVDNLPLPGIQ